jgi:hypothetical protein
MRPSRFTSLFSRIAAICMAVAPASAWAGLLLAFDPGVISCPLGGTPPDSCTGGVTDTSVSWWSIDLGADGIDENDKRAFTVGPDEGITIGVAQPAPAIDTPWNYFGNTGMHESTASVDFSSTTTLGFLGWAVVWNAFDIALGGDPAGYPYQDPASTQPDTGEAIITCTPSPCVSGSIFVLDYDAHIQAGDPSGFGGARYTLHLEGTVTGSTDTDGDGANDDIDTNASLAQADLIASSTADGSVCPGGQLNITSSMTNQSLTTDAGDGTQTVFVGWSLATSPDGSGQVVNLGNWQPHNVNLAPGGVLGPLPFTISIPPGTTPGNYYFVSNADDSNNVIDESREDNNTGAAPVTVLSPNDPACPASGSGVVIGLGNNESGQLGDGGNSVPFSLAPVRVSGGGQHHPCRCRLFP